MIEAVVCDFGGVLSTPLLDAFVAYEHKTGIPLDALGKAMFATGKRTGANPLFELETGRMSEGEFIATLSAELTVLLEREITMDGFGEFYFAHLHANQPVVDFMRECRERGLKMAICTNNVREWEPLWRAKLPVDEIFEHVIDSAFVGIRKPDPAIYAMTLAALDTPAATAVLLDDLEPNCTAAREFGMQAVHFRSNDQALGELRALLG